MIISFFKARAHRVIPKIDTNDFGWFCRKLGKTVQNRARLAREGKTQNGKKI